jgi:translation initiation factor 2B subunit (eIF-2B alpha/beta/delta family)
VGQTLADRVEELRTDRGHGASWLARHAVETLLEEIEAGADPVATARSLAGSRPAIGAIAGALGRVLAAGGSPERVVQEASALLARRDRAAKAIAVLLKPRLAGTVLTHSASATVREALLYARPPRVVCTESEPGGEGADLAHELTGEGLDVELVADAEAPELVARADLVVVGADTIFRDGTLVNKIGTRRLAESARAAKVPVLVAAETFKLAPFEPVEQAEELFDVTPPALIELIVTDEGAHPPGEIRALVDRTPLLREGYALLHAGD